MRLTHIILAILAMALSTVTTLAAGAAVSVRAIAFVASNERGATDPRLAPYEATLRSNLRFESFRYTGESATSVAPGASASLSLPNGGRVGLQADNAGNVRVQRGGAVVTVSRGRPAVFMGGPAGRGGVSGVIVLAD